MKVLKTAVMVVGAVAAIATGVGAIAGLGMIAGIGMGTIAAVGTLASVASMALNFISPPKPRSSTVAGTQTQFRLDPAAGIPYAVGRTAFGGQGVHRDTWGKDNEYQGNIIVWSGGGPIEAIETFKAAQEAVGFAGTSAIGKYDGFMWLQHQLGAVPSPALPSPIAGFPGWGADSKLSGYAASAWVTKFDTKGKKYAGGLPPPLAVLRGVKVYDPRLDSTYPGGSGPCRALDESTYVGGTSAQNPWLHALTWALGRWHNAKKVLGVGMALASIHVPSFVDAANVADANGWKIGGVVSSVDDKWQVLRMMAQAGGGQCTRLGARLTAFVNAPRVSIATITRDDLAGRARVAATQMQRKRINGVVPVFRSEAHGWEQVPAAPVRFAEYVLQDGKRRTEETEFVLVQDSAQAAELAAYEILNSREIGPIDLPLTIRWLGLEPGDQVNIDIPDELGLDNQAAVALVRGLDPTNGNVNVSFRSETVGKHDLALGRTTTVPPSPSLAPRDLETVLAPLADAWALEARTVPGADGAEVPVLAIVGETDNLEASHVVFEYRPVGYAGWVFAGTEDASVVLKEIGGIAPGVMYEAAVSYVVRGVRGDRRILIPVASGALISSDFSASDQLALDLAALDADIAAAESAIAANDAEIADLFDVYGDTASAAASASAAAAHASNAATAASNAETAESNAEAALAQAQTARDQAVGASTAAQEAKTAAESAEADALAAASAAAGSASAAAGHATTATTKANEAAGSASAAAGSATTATTKAGEASVSAGAAASSATTAEGHKNAAANSATVAATARDAAQGHASAASTSASTAGTHATNAASSASAANTAKNQAETARGQAQTFASNAASSATDAAGSASSADTSASVAASTAAELFPSDFSQGGRFWSYSYYGDPKPQLLNGTFVPVEGVGLVYEDNTFRSIYPRGYISKQVGRRVRFSARLRCATNATNGGGTTVSGDVYGATAEKGAAGPLVVTYEAVPDALMSKSSLTEADGWIILGREFVIPADAPPFMTPRVYYNWGNGGTNGNSVVQVAWFKIEDVTDSHAAGVSATAAAGSASSAASSQSAAASSASAAQTAATTATTKAGEASTSASQASTSASDALGYRNAASTHATNAANSATAAGNSASAASGSASTASTHASNAGASASSAQTAANTASTKAGEASTSASNAASSASNASGSANIAGTSATVAVTSAAALFPSDFSSEGRYFSSSQTGQNPPDLVVDFPVVEGVGKVAQAVGFQNIFTQGYIKPIVGRRYRVSTRLRAISNATNGGGTNVLTQFLGLNADFSDAGPILGTNTSSPGMDYGKSSLVVADGWVDLSADFIPAATPNAYIRPRVYFNWRGSGSVNGDSTVQVAYLKVEDVTDSYAAGASATAAAGSASTAATHADAAGISASAAQTSATTATTKAGEASTSASQASTSASNALGYRNTASTHATNAANSATQAGNSASAASSSASTANTKASEASSSASAAQTAATQAQGHATNASGSASTATSQASVATSSAAAAEASASLAAKVAGGGVVSNALFADWVTTSQPSGWGFVGAASGSTLTRIAGTMGPYAARMAGVAGASTYMGQTIGSASQQTCRTGQWWVLEADITLVSGDLVGAGVFMQTRTSAAGYLQNINLPFSTSPDSTGAVVGGGAAGQSYRFSKLIQITVAGAHQFGIYAAANYIGLGSEAAAGTIDFHRVSARPATLAEIRDQTVLGPLEATVSTQGSTLATLSSQYASLSSTVSTQGVTISNHATALSTQSGQITTLFGRAGVKVDVNGRVTGWETNNNGTVGNFVIHADNFAIEKPGGGARTEFSNGSWRVYDAAGVLRVKLGNLA